MKLGRWIVLALVTFFASCAIGAYQSSQSDPTAVLIAQTSPTGSSHSETTHSISTTVISSTPKPELSPDGSERLGGASLAAPIAPIDSSQTWLLEFPQHWVQNGQCQIRGTLKTLLVQKDNALSGRLHWVWNGQNDAAIFTGKLSSRTVQLQMAPPKVGGFAITFKGKTTDSGTIEGRALAKSVCKGKNGTFVLTPLSQPLPSPQAKSLPLFEKPFDDEYLISNYFDHDQPRQFVDNNGYLTNWQGDRLDIGNPGAGIDGHGGYDWGVPENTPLKAVADGVVTFAGEGTSFYCPPLQQDTTGNYVYILHTAPNGEQFETEYVHLSDVDVKKGDRVTSGQIIGLSGNTGCSTGPHLHFGVRRMATDASGDRTLIDPYGWDSPQTDPWHMERSGTESVWLWKVNQAPVLYEYGR